MWANWSLRKCSSDEGFGGVGTDDNGLLHEMSLYSSLPKREEVEWHDLLGGIYHKGPLRLLGILEERRNREC